MSLYSELKRRSVVSVALAYLTVSCVLVALADTVFPLLGIPHLGVNVLAITCALGFLPALVMSWSYAWTSGGLVREAPIARSSAKRMDIVLACVIVSVLTFWVAGYFWLDMTPVQQQTNSTEAIEDAQTRAQYPDNSIAVLPFVNMSDEPANEYFSDGISEELLHLLARIPSLSVISRSSAFSFKGKDFSIREVADKLHVAHVLEGSVRKSGNQVRVTAQLIDAQSDTHLWSGTYDRMLDDIFAIQDEIAASVVTQLKLTILGEAPRSEQINTEVYTLYLQARYVGREYSGEGFERSNALYEEALAIDPDYAPAWSGLSTNYTNQVSNGLLSSERGLALARSAAEKAIERDPKYAPAHANLGWLAYGYDNDVAQAARHYERALKLDPVNTYIMRVSATLLRSLNRPDDAILLGEYFTTRDPATASGHTNLGLSYLRTGRFDEAITSHQTALKLSPDYIGAHYRIGSALLLKGKPALALEAFIREKDEEYRVKGSALALYALGRNNESKAKLEELIERWGDHWPSEVAHVFAYTGNTDMAFQWLEKAIEQKEEGFMEQIFHPFYEPIHEDSRWTKLLELMDCSPDQLGAIKFEVTLPGKDQSM